MYTNLVLFFILYRLNSTVDIGSLLLTDTTPFSCRLGEHVSFEHYSESQNVEYIEHSCNYFIVITMVILLTTHNRPKLLCGFT